MRKLLALLLAIGLAACAVGPNYHRPVPLADRQVRLSEVRDNVSVTSAPPPARWWHLYDDAELDRLVVLALAKNTDVRVARANLQRARAFLREAGASRLPNLTTSAQANRERVTSSQTGQKIDTDYFAAGFDASYEIDVFGRVSRSVEAARGDAEAAQAGVEAARVSVAAETARAYAQTCGFAAQANVARQTEALQRRTLDLTKRLFGAGRGTRSQVDQIQVLVEQLSAQVPVLEAERRSALYALAVLTGGVPADMESTAAARCATIPGLKQPLPVGDGRSLLSRRPDIRVAERTLAADTARIGVATAALYPSISLLGSASLGATSLAKLGSANALTYAIGPLISWNLPLLGPARARVLESKAVADGSLAKFDATILNALRETEQALARLQGVAQNEAALNRAVVASEDAARLSKLRFDYGADSFLQLLDADRQRAATRTALVQSQANLADAQISVFKALGGGWDQE
jgi:NodT family efflux transporter outer membrane factor (OMF) lipoprotein